MKAKNAKTTTAAKDRTAEALAQLLDAQALMAAELAALKAERAGAKLETMGKTPEPFTVTKAVFKGKPILTLHNGGGPFSFGSSKARLLMKLLAMKDGRALLEELAGK